METPILIKNFCNAYKPDFVFLSEPWIDFYSVPSFFWKNLGLKIFVMNNRSSLLPSLWGLCQEGLNPSIISVSDQQCAFTTLVEGHQVFVSAVYASTSYLKRRKLYKELLDLQADNPGPWCMFCDYNAVLGSNEVRGSFMPPRASCDDFISFTDAGNLTHLLTRGAGYTWSNRRRGNALTEKRLDRVICNEAWLDFWSNSSCCTLVRSFSDRFPLLLTANRATRPFPSSFKFHKMWISHPDGVRQIREVWSRPVEGCPTTILS